MQAEGNDFNIALGDTIYSDSEVPGKLNPVALTVAQKWGKYKLNLGQAPLADLRGAAGFYSHWDDHEFINDFSRFENVFTSGTINGQQLYERGVKAFTDYAPVDFSSRDGLYRTRRWGKNLELFFLDERSFRSAKASKDGVCDNPQTGQPDLAPTAPQSVRNAFALLDPVAGRSPSHRPAWTTINDPNRTFLGQRQLKKFLHDVKHSDARFKVVINEMPIQQYYALPYDRWEGYEADRQRVLSGLQGREERRLPDHRRSRHARQRRPIQDPGAGRPGEQRHPRRDRRARGDGEVRARDRRAPSASRAPRGLVDNLFFEPQPPSGVGMQCSGIDQFSYGEVRGDQLEADDHAQGHQRQPAGHATTAPAGRSSSTTSPSRRAQPWGSRCVSVAVACAVGLMLT